MESSFLGRAIPCIKEYERPGVRVQAVAELAPGIVAVFLMRWSYCFVIFFDRALHKPAFHLIHGLWGENIVYPKPWESRGVGFLPTGHEYPWANFKYLLPFAKKFFPETISWHEKPVKIVHLWGQGSEACLGQNGENYIPSKGDQTAVSVNHLPRGISLGFFICCFVCYNINHCCLSFPRKRESRQRPWIPHPSIAKALAGRQVRNDKKETCPGILSGQK